MTFHALKDPSEDGPDDGIPPCDEAAASAAELALQGLKPAAPPFALPTASPAEIRTAAFSAIHGFFMQRSVQPPTRIIVLGMTGSGKTFAGELLRLLVDIRSLYQYVMG